MYISYATPFNLALAPRVQSATEPGDRWGLRDISRRAYADDHLSDTPNSGSIRPLDRRICRLSYLSDARPPNLAAAPRIRSETESGDSRDFSIAPWGPFATGHRPAAEISLAIVIFCAMGLVFLGRPAVAVASLTLLCLVRIGAGFDSPAAAPVSFVLVPAVAFGAVFGRPDVAVISLLLVCSRALLASVV